MPTLFLQCYSSVFEALLVVPEGVEIDVSAALAQRYYLSYKNLEGHLLVANYGFKDTEEM